MRILVVGSGIAGLAFLAFLNRDAHDIDIVDKSAEWPNKGFSIGFWSNARAVLRKIGLAERFDENGKRFRRLVIRKGNGELIRDFNLSKFNTELGVALVDIKRSQLHDWLFEKAGKPAVRLGKKVTRIKEEGNRVHVVFSDGEEQSYDLVVGADGIHSTVRIQCLNSYEKFKNWRAWWMWVDAKFGEPHVLTTFVEAHAVINLFNEGERTLVNMVAHADHTIWDSEEGRMKRLEELFRSESALVPTLFQGHKDGDAMPTDLVRIKLKKWHTNRVVLIGDAAHGFEPSAGLGGSMGLEDAYVLAAELMKHGDKVTEALQDYEARRVPRVNRARRLTSKMGLWGMVDSPLKRKLIDFFLPFAPEGMLVNDYFRLLKEEL